MTHAPGKTIFIVPTDLAVDSAGPLAVVEFAQGESRTVRKRLNQLRYTKKAKISVTAPGSHPRKPAFLIWGITADHANLLRAEASTTRLHWLADGSIQTTYRSDGSPGQSEPWDDNFVYENDRPSHCVYVVRLSRQALEAKEFLEANPAAHTAKDLLYVGMTGTSWEERFAQHKRGYKASRVVRKHGVELVPGLCLGYMTYETAKVKEVEYANELRTLGYAVWQN